MNIPDPEATARNNDHQLGERIRAEVKALLNQQEDLAHLEKAAVVTEKIMRMSHEIRNPLATIQAVCGSLILETEDREQLERLQKISSQVEQLASVLAAAVNDDSDLDDPPSLVDLGNLARSLVNLLQYQAQADLRINLDLPASLCCRLPKRALTRSIYRLLYHALGALTGQAHGEIHLHCRKHTRHLEIRVVDNGPGFPPELLDQGLRAYAANHQGSLLELCSVERFARSLEGRLELNNRESGGARVCLWLPADCLET